eukprot:311633-Chlamydomonas_euryale.AAC.15
MAWACKTERTTYVAGRPAVRKSKHPSTQAADALTLCFQHWMVKGTGTETLSRAHSPIHQHTAGLATSV